MSAYDFILSSLPSLVFREKAPMTEEEFFARIQTMLAEAELDSLKATNLFPSADEKSPVPVINAWYDWERSLRILLAKARSSKTGFDSGTKSTDLVLHPELNEFIKQLSVTDNPLVAEDLLDETRFSFLEQLSSGHFFDRSALFLYRLKLALVLRRQNREIEAGKAGFQAVYQEVISGFDRHNTNGENQ